MPPKVVRCTTFHIYDYYYNTTGIEIEWHPLPVSQCSYFSLMQHIVSFQQDFGAVVTDDISASVISYEIFIKPVINVSFEANDSTICSSISCKYDYPVPINMSELSYLAYVVAKNILSDGYSERQVCHEKKSKIYFQFVNISVLQLYTVLWYT